MFKIKNNILIREYNGETLYIEPWGKNSLRTRAFPDGTMVEGPNALTKTIDKNDEIKINVKSNTAEIQNGRIRAIINHRDKITYYDGDKVILEEYIRLRAVKHDDGSEDASTIEITKDFNSTLKLKARSYKSDFSGKYEIITRFEPNVKEKIFGMGQYQHPYLDLKNTKLELAQRNSQISVPFYISSIGYGFLWNNPGIGEVTFAKNLTEWKMYSTNRIDYWITVGDTPSEIEENYSKVTGTVPLMPKNLLGLWQSKLRYRTEEEVLDVVKKYREKGINLSTIAIDYFHWPSQGEYCFDKEYWPNPKEMVSKLKGWGVEPIISVWPTVQTDAANYQKYIENGYLVKVCRGIPMTMQIQGNTTFVDMTNPEARNYVWSLLKENYISYGIKNFWLDVAEPGYSVYDFDNYRYKKGTNLEVGNYYPIDYLKMISYGLESELNKEAVTLVRGAWAGAQKYGALVWSGDIDSSFEALQNQINTGLNMGIAGIPWWTTDIGGFHGGDSRDDEFKELMIRWFQYATFSPILRMHGDRQPHKPALSKKGGGSMVTGSPNEIWSFGQEAEIIMTKYINVREFLKDYIFNLMKDAHIKGSPLMRTMFYEFPNDEECWDVDNQFMFGEDILVAPIIKYREKTRSIYLPDDYSWIDIYNMKEIEGGKYYEREYALDEIPLFLKVTNDLTKKINVAELHGLIKRSE